MPGLPHPLHHLLTMSANAGMYAPNPALYFNPAHATSFSQTGLLKETLNELIDWKKLNSVDKKCGIRLAVTALNVETGKLTVFRNYREDDKRKQDIGPPLGPEHTIARGCLPPAFPPPRGAGGRPRGAQEAKGGGGGAGRGADK